MTESSKALSDQDVCACCALPAEPDEVGPKRLYDGKVYCPDCAYAWHEGAVARLLATLERIADLDAGEPSKIAQAALDAAGALDEELRP